MSANLFHAGTWPEYPQHTPELKLTYCFNMDFFFLITPPPLIQFARRQNNRLQFTESQQPHALGSQNRDEPRRALHRARAHAAHATPLHTQVLVIVDFHWI